MTREDLDKCHNDEVREIEDICAILDMAGPVFSGGETLVIGVANEWRREEFTPNGVREWTDAGFWCPSTASRLYDLGWSAARCARRAEQLRRDGVHEDAIHYMCNGDFAITKFVGDED